ncbi:antiviral reverse transcriptase Drt3b [Campylobacter coli]|uniref:antiviral reverse transcriptase Drt3b n=1 Tax=Campylobacter coli TaxID=195 RepID=UPI000931C531|nr:antiviral reverse transcriptase Drt3b [Campylobacter coli]
MKYKKHKIRYKKERVVLSEILPYEVPLIFSNKNFYNFLLKYKTKINNYFNSNLSNTDQRLEIIFNILFKNKQLKKNATIPFHFKIPHKTNEYRKLSIIHPVHQIGIMNFYDTYKQTILYFSNRSEFSIRRPYKVANLFYHKNDFINTKKLDNELNNSIEIKNHEEKYFKTFFAYKKYSNIYMFYESYEYQKNEKLFKKLYKFDLSKCFDSIYTHSIAWAIYDKKIIKDNLNKINNTFVNAFDKLMQNMNYAETNGILIGPEFSRIFAELILQKIDKVVLNKLAESTENKILHKKDYVVFRYVDDYFLFYNEEDIKDLIIQTFNNELQKYKLYLNESKIEEFAKPFISNITMAKKKIKDLLKELDFDDSNNHIINSKNIIINFKAILKENEIKYNDILNYTLAIIDKKLDFIIENISKNITIKTEQIINKFANNNSDIDDGNKLKYYLKKIAKNKYKKIRDSIVNISNDIDFDIENLELKRELDTLEADIEKYIKNINEIEKFIKSCNFYGDKKILKEINNAKEKIEFCEVLLTPDIKHMVNEASKFFSFSKSKEFNKIQSIIKKDCLKIKNKLFTHLKEMLKFVFFIYSESEKTSATIKLSLILVKLINFINYNYLDKYLKNKLYKLIFDEIYHLLKRNKTRKYSHNQNLYLLINLKEIKNYKKLDFNILEAIFLNEEMNYFDIVVLLYYIENNPEFKKIKDKIKERILKKYEDFNDKNTELTLLSMDIFACPFLDRKFKIKILECCKIEKKDIQNYIINFSMKQKFWFVKWKNINILKELEEKKSYEVY